MIQQARNQHSDIVERLIASQQELTAVEKFSQRYQSVTEPAQESLYKDLIPLSAPSEGEQYSFEIDLDACSGCKACVAACHSLNGLEEGEIWRNVGLMTGGDDFNPVVQHVTSACHHCVEPGCMSGCPVRAYEKDPITGIVEHLDDQCIGCKYCMLTCPYDVPSYSKSKGIVRKCNMCVDRLRVGEAPACVQACPHQAIKIRTVETSSLTNSADAGSLLPGAPDSRLTFPTTSYLSERSSESTGLPVDFYSAKSQHAHFPLVFMLVLTQLALGIFAVSGLLSLTGVIDATLFKWLSVAGFVTLSAGLSVALLHLGRPTKAYRAMSGFRTSWLSREIIGFNLFAGAATQLVIACFLFPDYAGLMAIGAIVTGIIAVQCSVMLYVVTGRPFWNAKRTHSFFYLSALVAGAAAAVFALSVSAGSIGLVAGLLIVATIAKLFVESRLMQHLSSDDSSTEKLAAQLVAGEQRYPALARVCCAVIGGLLIPLMLLTGFSSVALAAACLAFVLCGEVLERYLFFTVSVARRMPGAPN